jgi:uncharacterized protein
VSVNRHAGGAIAEVKTMPGLYETDVAAVLHAAKQRFGLDLDGIHGLSHWERVRENGVRVAQHSGANLLIVELFAYLHDSCREDDGSDPEHGERAARFAGSLRGTVLQLADEDFALLHQAIRDHTLGLTQADVTVMACWDADRLDLGRVFIKPHASRLCTDYAKRTETIEWALRRSRA